MKKTKAILIAAVICTMASICWGQSYWKRTYGGMGDDQASAITPTPDGNFIVAGWTNSFGAGNYDVYLLKITPYGDTLWTKTYGGTGDDFTSAITPTPDGNFIVAGYTISFGAGNYDVYLLKIKPNGDTLWTKTYGGTGWDDAYAITPTLDGNFIVAGSTSPYGGGFFIKIKPNGDTLWTRVYGGPDRVVGNAITPTSDGNFIVAGSNADACCFLMKITPNGDSLWTKCYNGNDFWAFASAITPTFDGNFIVAGVMMLKDYSLLYDVYLLKIKSNGETVWTKTYGGTDFDQAFAIAPTPDGNFLVAGKTGAGSYDIYLIKIKPNGDSLWTKTYGETCYDCAQAFTPTPDGNFIVTGYNNGNIFFLSINRRPLRLQRLYLHL